jgi:hypothetical protein
MKTSTRRPRTATINLSDFMRIQNEIIPSKNAIVERKNYDEKLKTASRGHILNFPDSNMKNFNEKQKEKFLRDEMRKRKIDEIEKEYQEKEKNLVNMRAKKMNFENKDDIKSFHSQLLVSDCLNERRFQEDIKRQKKEMEDNINKRYYEMEIEKMREYDKNEELKKKINSIKEECKMKEMKEIEKLNYKIKSLILDLENEKSKNENWNKKYQKLEERYLKISSELRKKTQEVLYIQTKKMKEIKLGQNMNNKNNKSQKIISNTLPLINSLSNVNENDIENIKNEDEQN